MAVYKNYYIKFSQNFLSKLKHFFLIDSHYKSIYGPVRSECFFLQGGCGLGLGWCGAGTHIRHKSQHIYDNFMDNDGAPDIASPKSIRIHYRNFTIKRHSYTKSGRGQHNLKNPGKPLLTVLLELTDGTQGNYEFILFKSSNVLHISNFVSKLGYTDCYHPHMKLRKGNVFTYVCLFTGDGFPRGGGGPRGDRHGAWDTPTTDT